MRKKNKTKCPIWNTMEIISKKWSVLIIYTLLSGDKRFKEIEDSLPMVCPKMISERLKELEKLKLIERKVYPQRPVKITYTLSKKGKSLYKIIEAIKKWEKKWLA